MTKEIDLETLRTAVELSVNEWDMETLINFAIDTIMQRAEQDNANGMPAHVMFDDSDGIKWHAGGMDIEDAKRTAEQLGEDAFYVAELR